MSTMLGPGILARTLSRPTRRGKSSRAWQYHSRSDHHSKVVCWTILFDFLRECDAFQADVRDGLVGVAVNHVLVGPINKTLDLVVCRLSASARRTDRIVFSSLTDRFEVQLDAGEQGELDSLPVLPVEDEDDVSEVMIALEAKACMTAHVKSLPRLHAEILAASFLAKQAQPHCLTVSHTLVNAASCFTSPGKGDKNEHVQPTDTYAVLDMLRNAIPRTDRHSFGYDVMGASVVECCNDESPVTCVEEPPAPQKNDFLNYERMISSLCSAYRGRFRR